MSWFYCLSDAGLVAGYRRLISVTPIRWLLKIALGLGAILGAFVLFYLVREPFSPTDWIELTLRNVPPNTRQIYLIADRPEGIRALNWYISKVIVDSADPRMFGQMWSRDRSEDQRFGEVQWRNARRYGALAQLSDGSWKVWWLEPDDMTGPSPARYLVCGGKAEVRLPDEKLAEIATSALLESVGLTETGP